MGRGAWWGTPSPRREIGRRRRTGVSASGRRRRERGGGGGGAPAREGRSRRSGRPRGGRREGVCARVTWSRLPSPSAALAAAVRWLQEAAAPPLCCQGPARSAARRRRRPLSPQPALRPRGPGPGAPPVLPMRGPRDHRCLRPGAARR